MLWDAIERNDVPLALRALALGAPVDDTIAEDDESNENAFVQTAAHRATQLQHWQILALLLLWGADVEAIDSQGRNLVHYLSDLPPERIPVLLSVLRKNAALATVQDGAGKTPLQLAEEAENGQVATVLRVFVSQSEKRALNFDSNSGVETPVMGTKEVVKEQLADAFNKVLRLSRPFRRGKKKKRSSVNNE